MIRQTLESAEKNYWDNNFRRFHCWLLLWLITKFQKLYFAAGWRNIHPEVNTVFRILQWVIVRVNSEIAGYSLRPVIAAHPYLTPRVFI